MKKVTKKYFLYAALLLLFLLVKIDCSREKNSLTIGAILPLTGDAALYGLNAKEGIDLATEELNNKGGLLGKKIIIRYEDSKADPKTAVSAFQKLITVDKVQAVIGDITSSVTLAIAPIAEKNHVVVLSPAATSPKITEAGSFIFRN